MESLETKSIKLHDQVVELDEAESHMRKYHRDHPGYKKYLRMIGPIRKLYALAKHARNTSALKRLEKRVHRAARVVTAVIEDSEEEEDEWVPSESSSSEEDDDFDFTPRGVRQVLDGLNSNIPRYFLAAISRPMDMELHQVVLLYGKEMSDLYADLAEGDDGPLVDLSRAMKLREKINNKLGH